MSSSEKLNNDSFITKQMNLEECCNCFGSCSTASEFFCRKNDIVCLKPVDSEAIENSENHNVNYDHCLVTRGDEKLECLTLFEAYPVEPFNSEYGELIVANNWYLNFSPVILIQ